MNKKLFIVLPLLFILSGVLFSMYVSRLPLSSSNDVISFSRVAKEAGNHWFDMENASFQAFPYPFCIIDLDGNIRYQTAGDVITSSGQALKENCPVLDVDYSGKIVGKVIYATRPDSRLVLFQHSIAGSVFFFTLLLAVAVSLYLYYLDRKIIHPFRELERFAVEVSQGNLDFPLKIQKNNLFGAYTESFDLLREQLMLGKEKERDAARNQKELVASLSHDIKTPVTSIKLTAELLMEMETNERLCDKIGMIYNKTEQIEELVNNLFHTTLNDMEHLTVSCLSVYVDVLEAIIKAADYKGRVQISDLPPCMIYVDELRLSQIFSNIFSNSYKYADTNIEVEAILLGSHLKLSILDFGQGVPESELPLIFNKFYRGSNADNQTGSGLGLYICKKLLEQMQGEICCTRSGKGFSIILLLKLV